MTRSHGARDSEGYPHGVPKDLGDGLWLKAVHNAADVERPAAFNAFVYQHSSAGVFTRWLLGGSHPTVQPPDFLFVQDTVKGEIVSTLGLVVQTWSYEGIPLQVGQVELVGTHPDYRQRGLIRAQMEVIDQMLVARQCALSAIEGIPYFYRQFGYEYAIPLGGCANLRLDQVPALGEEKQEPVAIRRMNIGRDLPKVMALYEAQAAQLCVAALRSEALWYYQDSAPLGVAEAPETYVVEDATGMIGYFRVRKNMWGPLLEFSEASVRPGGHVWGSQGALLAMLRFAKRLAVQRSFSKLCFALPKTDPLTRLALYLGAESERQYAWQIRIVDPVNFVQHIAPALERRLAQSLLAGFSGDLVIDVMPERIHLRFEQGCLVQVAPEGSQGVPWDLRMPPLLLTQLLLGHRSCDEIMACHLDAFVRPAAGQLADVLFPRRQSFVHSM